MSLKKMIKLLILTFILFFPIKAWAFTLNLNCPETITSESIDCDLIFVPGEDTIENIKMDLDLTNITSYQFININPTDIEIVSIIKNIINLDLLNNITSEKEIGRFRFTIGDPSEDVSIMLTNILGDGMITSLDVSKNYHISTEPEPIDPIPSPPINNEPTNVTLSNLTITDYNLNFDPSKETYYLALKAVPTTLNFVYTQASSSAIVTVLLDDSSITGNSVNITQAGVLKFKVTNGNNEKIYTVNISINDLNNPYTGISVGGYVIIITILIILGTYLIIDKKTYGR